MSLVCCLQTKEWNIQFLGISMRSFQHAASDVLPVRSNHMAMFEQIRRQFLRQFSILLKRNLAKCSSDKGALGELTRMAAVMPGSSVSTNRLK